MKQLDNVIKLLTLLRDKAGSPFSTESIVNFQRSLELDELELFPIDQVQLVQQLGIEFLIPQSVGGKLETLLLLYFIGKATSRRDLTVAIGLGQTFLASLPIWIAGTKEQKEFFANEMRNGGLGCLALTEEEHGSDIAANEMIARPHDNGWLISGKKWCVNNATIGSTTTLLCKTHPEGGLLGFSLFLIDKKSVKGEIRYLPKFPTYGVRGLDISGFEFDNVWVPQSALVGAEGHGLEITYKTLQISRTLCANFSIGAADTALRFALKFTLNRKLYGKPAFEISAVKQRLAEDLIYILISECATIAALRAISLVPERMSLWSAFIKFLIPKISESIVESCGVVIGARSYLRNNEWGIFQKIGRDNQVIGLFDGSSQVNLSIIASMMVSQARKRALGSTENQKLLTSIFDLSVDIPVFTAEGLAAFNRKQDEIISALPYLKSEGLDEHIALLGDELLKLDKQVLELADANKFDKYGLNEFRLAEKYCWLFAASCTIQMWIYSKNYFPNELQNISWVKLALQLMLSKINDCSPYIDPTLQNETADCLKNLFEQNKMFSIIPISLLDGH